MGIHGLKDKPTKYIGLYKNRPVFQEFNETKKTYEETTICFSEVRGGNILKTEHVNYTMIKTSSFESVHYTISVHIEYEKMVKLATSTSFDQIDSIN